MVSTKLVDGRANPSTAGWSFYLVEVHHSRLAPIMGLDRLWRRFDRLDTVPHIRSLGTVAVVGDTLVIGVGGSSATAWSYDVRTKELTRSPTPEWLNRSWVTPPPSLSPDGRYIAYLSQDQDTSRLTVRSWPDGRVVLQSAPIHPRQLNPPHGGVYWRNPKELQANVPVFDSGPSIAWLAGVVRGNGMEVTTWKIYPDYHDPTVRRPAAAEPPAPATQRDTIFEQRFDRAASTIARLPLSAFPDLPAAFVRELAGCTVPQSFGVDHPHNVIRGSFAAKGQTDYAVLCSYRGESAVRIGWGGPARCPSVVLSVPDRTYLQAIGNDSIGYSRVISATNTRYFTDEEVRDRERRQVLEHDAIEDSFIDKGSSIWICRDGEWVELPGAD